MKSVSDESSSSSSTDLAIEEEIRKFPPLHIYHQNNQKIPKFQQKEPTHKVSFSTPSYNEEDVTSKPVSDESSSTTPPSKSVTDEEKETKLDSENGAHTTIEISSSSKETHSPQITTQASPSRKGYGVKGSSFGHKISTTGIQEQNPIIHETSEVPGTSSVVPTTIDEDTYVEDNKIQTTLKPLYYETTLQPLGEAHTKESIHIKEITSPKIIGVKGRKPTTPATTEVRTTPTVKPTTTEKLKMPMLKIARLKKNHNHYIMKQLPPLLHLRHSKKKTQLKKLYLLML
ncbi:hypothetical protein CEXT_731481 [Caerostris extrusa]|uniref:Uncharacterized protein n=1 Tax=Caerostris extrusa TaxID=172846 RepID=A0AAV4SUR6_CAEEX|nr:hypothetical protein CEXT_731481 [Caerostris extrusa]